MCGAAIMLGVVFLLQPWKAVARASRDASELRPRTSTPFIDRRRATHMHAICS
jgi:hypothetical protein